MYRPPPERRVSEPPEEPTWRGILAGYGLVAATFLSLVVASYPLAGSVAVATLVGFLVLGRRVASVVRCLAVCREIKFDLGAVRVTVTRGQRE